MPYDVPGCACLSIALPGLLPAVGQQLIALSILVVWFKHRGLVQATGRG